MATVTRGELQYPTDTRSQVLHGPQVPHARLLRERAAYLPHVTALKLMRSCRRASRIGLGILAQGVPVLLETFRTLPFGAIGAVFSQRCTDLTLSVLLFPLYLIGLHQWSVVCD